MNVKMKHRTWWNLLAGGVIALAAIGGSVVGYWKWKYPYGWSHCCITVMGLSLRTYAMDHGGRFPTGGETPEASLSLLYSNYENAHTLRGKAVPLEVAQAALARNGKLGPDSCGWHYVEGLTEADDPEIAILWDKSSLDHNGGRVRGGGHEVAFVDGSSRYVSGARWPEFLKRQEQLLAQRDERAKQALPALTARICFPDGKEVSDYEGAYTLYISSESQSGTESSIRTELRWMRFQQPDGPCTLTLELPDKRLRSKPVQVQVSSRRVTPDAIVFEMEPY